MAERAIPLRPSAADAWNRIATHEEVCAERYKNLDRGQGELTTLLRSHVEDTSKRFGDLNKFMLTGAISLLVMAVGIIGYLLTITVVGLHP